MPGKSKIAVISSGNAGQTMAAYFANMGYSVSLYVRDHERVMMFPRDRVFRLSGAVEAVAAIDLISNDMAQVIKDAYLIMVTTPAQYHPDIARELAPCLEDGQIVVLNPGRTFGTCVVKKTLEEEGCRKNAIIAEAETLVFACRCARVAEPFIHGIKDLVRVAAHNPADTSKVVEELSQLFPGIIRPAESTLHTGFSNMGVIFHPLPILLNITRVEAKEKFHFYTQGISPLVANILERLDRERVSIARAYGVGVLPVFDWLAEHYGSKGETLYEKIQNTPSYANILAPIDVDTRYIFEDVYTGCVPMYYAGLAIGMDAPIINSAIVWASTIYETDFKQYGRNDKAIDFSELLSNANRRRT